jgi:hypothetical protein
MELMLILGHLPLSVNLKNLKKRDFWGAGSFSIIG